MPCGSNPAIGEITASKLRTPSKNGVHFTIHLRVLLSVSFRNFSISCCTVSCRVEENAFCSARDMPFKKFSFAISHGSILPSFDSGVRVEVIAALSWNKLERESRICYLSCNFLAPLAPDAWRWPCNTVVISGAVAYKGQPLITMKAMSGKKLLREADDCAGYGLSLLAPKTCPDGLCRVPAT